MIKTISVGWSVAERSTKTAETECMKFSLKDRLPGLRLPGLRTKRKSKVQGKMPRESFRFTRTLLKGLHILKGTAFLCILLQEKAVETLPER